MENFAEKLGFTVEEKGIKPGFRTYYTYGEKNEKGESLLVEITEVYPDNAKKNSLPNLWKKLNLTDRLFKNYLFVDTYVTDNKGNCYGKYNPQILYPTVENISRARGINLNYMLEISDANKGYLLREILKRFTGRKF